MDEQALRALVRNAVERHLGRGAAPELTAAPHSSHARFRLQSGADIEGPCLIEPTVPCNHCGYCQSHGH